MNTTAPVRTRGTIPANTTQEKPTMTQYTVDAYGGTKPGDTVAIWESHNLNNARRRHYINQPSGDLDPATQRATSYGVRGDGQAEDGVHHAFVGMGRIIRAASTWEPIYCWGDEGDACSSRDSCTGHTSPATWIVETAE